MADESHKRGSTRKPVGLQVRLAFGDQSEFVERYATNISDGGIFIRSRDRRPVGSRLAFELRLRTGEVVFSGEGVVRWVQGLDSRGLGVPGMGLAFDDLTAESKAILDRILTARSEHKVGEAVEGASPAAWKPLSEFPVPAVEEAPEVAAEVQAPPVLGPAPARAPDAAPLPTTTPPLLAELHRALGRIDGNNAATQKARGTLPSSLDSSSPRPVVLAPSPVAMPARQAPETTAPQFGRGEPGQSSLASLGFAPAPMISEDVPLERTLPLGGLRRAAAPAPPIRHSLGLDFGWSAVRVATSAGGKPRAVELAGGRGGFPSLLADQKGRLLVGAAAREAMLAGAPAARGLLRLLSPRPGAALIGAWKRRNLSELQENPGGPPSVKLGARLLSATEAAELVVDGTRAAAASALGGEVGTVVVAVPHSYSEPARRALRGILRSRGLEIQRLVSNAAASVLAIYGATGRRRVLVADFGEGSIEASIVEQTEHVLEVVATASEVELGGADLDLTLLELLLTDFEKQTGLLVPEDTGVFERVREAAADARDALAESLDHEVLVPDLVPAGLSRAELRQRLPRARLQALFATQAERAFEVVRNVLASRGFGGADLDEILLLGSRAPPAAFVRRMADKLGREPVRPPNAADAPALGAALLAEGLAAPGGEFVVQSCLGLTLGIGQATGHFKRIVERNQSLPAERAYTAVTAVDGQRQMEFTIYQGERPRASDNELIGIATVNGIPNAPKGEARVMLQLQLDEDGELSVRARDASTGRELPAVLDRTRTADSVLPSLAAR